MLPPLPFLGNGEIQIRLNSEGEVKSIGELYRLVFFRRYVFRLAQVDPLIITTIIELNHADGLVKDGVTSMASVAEGRRIGLVLGLKVAGLERFRRLLPA